MENASKALIMAAEILLGIILLTICVGAYYSWNNLASDINKDIELTKIQEFNRTFTIYDNSLDSKAHDLTTHDLISILNFVKEYNKQVDDYSKVVITSNFGIDSNTQINNMSEFISKNEGGIFSLNILKYNEVSGRVKEIKLTKK